MHELCHLVRYLVLPQMPWPGTTVVVEADLARIWRRTGRWRFGRRSVPATFGSFDVICLGPYEGLRYRIDEYLVETD